MLVHEVLRIGGTLAYLSRQAASSYQHQYSFGLGSFRSTATEIGSRPSSSTGSRWKLYSTSLITPEPEEDNDPFKWDRMFIEGEAKKKGAFWVEGDEKDLRTAYVSDVRVVSFDLDNTLWKTDEVIGAANDALADYIKGRGFQQPNRTEEVMGKLYRTSTSAGDGRYGPPPSPSGSGSDGPVQLTALRKDAIRWTCVEHNGMTADEADVVAEEAFAVWTAARHAAIPNHLAGNVVESLQTIRQSLPDVVLCAVTDGNSDPLSVDLLSPYFDFCVRAEDVGVAKPDRRVYEAAVDRVAESNVVADIFGDIRGGGDGGSILLTKDLVEDRMGAWWVHVGDNFMKDIVAAKEFKMRTVWCRELLPKEVIDGEEDDNRGSSYQQPKGGAQEVKEFVKKLSTMKTVRMAVGTVDFLADSMVTEFADAVIDEFRSLPGVLQGWHDEFTETMGTTSPNSASSADADTGTDTKGIITQLPHHDHADTVSMPEPSMVVEDPENNEVTSTSTTVPSQSPAPQIDTKFCVYCGEKLPRIAKFCSTCGNKQPAL